MRIAVGHGHDRHFLQAEDVLEPGVVGQRIDQRQFGRAGIAEDVAHPRVVEHLQQGLGAGGAGHG